MSQVFDVSSIYPVFSACHLSYAKIVLGAIGLGGCRFVGRIAQPYCITIPYALPITMGKAQIAWIATSV